jgi:arylsulfatase A-like enzyme
VDWLPTISRLAGFQPEKDLKWDGQDVWPVLTGKARGPARDLYWKGPGGRSFAVRSGDWKLVAHEAGDGKGRRTELFNLREDPYEERDRAATERETAMRLNQLLVRERSRDDDALPGRNRTAGTSL